MALAAEYRDRPAVEVAILDALADRSDDGMTVLELRAAVDADIDRIEAALSTLKSEGLITVDDETGTVRIRPADHVLAEPGATDEDDPTLLEILREKLGL
jgi:DNA-binding IclR family transcriptional regulator